MIDDNIKNALFEYLGGICKGLECYPVKVGGYKNHVYIMFAIAKNCADETTGGVEKTIVKMD